MISIDPWRSAPGEEYADISNVSQPKHEAFLQEAQQRLGRFGERSAIWRMTSAAAAAQIASGSLDFVYLDARHDYESVKRDLELWYDKIRPGGIFAGHDYLDGDLPQGVFGVKSAVDEFFGSKGLDVKSTHADPPWISWFVEVRG